MRTLEPSERNERGDLDTYSLHCEDGGVVRGFISALLSITYCLCRRDCRVSQTAFHWTTVGNFLLAG